MEWLNYHHLLYFYTVAREGSVKRAGEVLQLAQPTLSGQIRKLEESLGETLFEREGRGLKLTESGHLVYRYADEIFTTGRELQDALRGRPTRGPARLIVGLADVVPKLLACRVLETALRLEEPVQLVVHEDRTEDLLTDLAQQRYDMVLADAPIGPQSRIKAHNHPIARGEVGFFARPDLQAALEGDFPGSLDGAPFLAPTRNTTLRHDLDRFFEALDIRPRLVAEVEDSALLKAFGAHGHGVFPAPMLLADELRRRHGVEPIGASETLQSSLFLITVERRIGHPAVAAIVEAAREGRLE
ncbi:MAG: LysR family transcriptional regulator [Myxococcota bacterium]